MLVSIPLRYAKNLPAVPCAGLVACVSIPLRYAKNLDNVKKKFNQKKFQFLLGTLKTRPAFALFVADIASFNSS